MKIDSFNTTTACNIPRKLSLRDPFSGKVITDEEGKTLDIYLYGIKSDIARNATKALKRAMSIGTEEGDADAGSDYLAAITQGWSSNIEDDDGPIEFSLENAKRIYLEQDWIADQATRFVREVSNYDPKRYSQPSSGSKKERGLTARQTAQK